MLNECFGLWVLKNPSSAQTASNSVIEKCPPGPRKSFVGHPGAMNFCEFSEDEFFNTHVCYRQVISEVQV